MIIRAEDLLQMEEFKGQNVSDLCMKTASMESLIRAYTNNNFQNRAMRITAASKNGVLIGHSPYFAVGDTVQISQTEVNDRLYSIVEITEDKIKLDAPLYDISCNTVTKIVYPPDVRKGVIDLMIWEKDNRKKVGIKSETLSRHTVAYYDQDAENQVMGYPVSLLGFLKPYIKPRF